jgi:hypothetical protein
MASTPHPPPRPQPPPPPKPAPPSPPRSSHIEGRIEGTVVEDQKRSSPSPASEHESVANQGESTPAGQKKLDRKAKDAKPKHPISDDAFTLFHNGHKIAKDGDPPSKWISMGRLGDGTPVIQGPMTPEIEKEIQDGDYYLAEGLSDEDPTAPAPPAGPPTVVDAPYVSGSGVIGEPLSCTKGNWTNEPTDYRYQWKKMQEGNPAVLPDATNPTYAPTAQDANKDVFCTVLATNAAGQAASDSNMITIQPPAEAHAQRSK